MFCTFLTVKTRARARPPIRRAHAPRTAITMVAESDGANPVVKASAMPALPAPLPAHGSQRVLPLKRIPVESVARLLSVSEQRLLAHVNVDERGCVALH